MSRSDHEDLPGNVRLTTLLFDIFLGLMFLTIESPIKITVESLVTLLSLFSRTVLAVDVLFERLLLEFMVVGSYCCYGVVLLLSPELPCC